METNLLTEDRIERSYLFYSLTQGLREFNWVETLAFE